MGRLIRWFLLFLLLILHPALAQFGTDGSLGDSLSIKLALIGPGDALYLSWGHIGIIVENTLTGKSRFYDYGLFSFNTEDFFVNFAFGRLTFLVGSSPTDWSLANAKADNRELILMTLNLPGTAKADMQAFLEENVRPENSTYLYDHFVNNCATKVRDILNQATDGQVYRLLAGKPGRMALRAHTRRHLSERPFFDWFLPFLMGPVADTPLTIWEELFLPAEFLRVFKDFTYRDGEGNERSLVTRVETYYPAKNRKPVSEDPPPPPRRLYLFGLALAAIAGVGRRLYPRRGGKLLLGLLNSGVGLFFGGLGALLFFMRFFTNHDFTAGNLNLLFINPLLLPLIPLGIMIIKRAKRHRPPPSFSLHLIWTVAASAALAAGILYFLPFSLQKNNVTLMIFLPCALVMSYYPRWITICIKGIHLLTLSYLRRNKRN